MFCPAPQMLRYEAQAMAKPQNAQHDDGTPSGGPTSPWWPAQPVLPFLPNGTPLTAAHAMGLPPPGTQLHMMHMIHMMHTHLRPTHASARISSKTHACHMPTGLSLHSPMPMPLAYARTHSCRPFGFVPGKVRHARVCTHASTHACARLCTCRHTRPGVREQLRAPADLASFNK